MKLVPHRRFRSDVNKIMDYYGRAGHPELARDFYRELRGFMLDAARRPGRYHFFKADLRRVNLKRSPTGQCPSFLARGVLIGTVHGLAEASLSPSGPAPSPRQPPGSLPASRRPDIDCRSCPVQA